MATRRIARGRGGSPVPIIVLSVLLVGAVGLAIVLGMKTGELRDQVAQAEQKVRDQQDRNRKDALEFRKYETLVGLKLDGMSEHFEQLKSALGEKAPLAKKASGEDKGEGEEGPRKLETVTDLLDAYASEVVTLRDAVKESDGKLQVARKDLEQATTDKDKTEEEKAAAAAKASEEAGKLREDKAKVQEELDKARKKLSAEVEALKLERTKLTKDVNNWKKGSEIRDKKVKGLLVRNEELKKLQKTRGRLVDGTVSGEPVDGKIITVEADGKHVMIDVGRRDWAQIGMEFEVFDNADPESRKVKGHIQVRRVFDVIAQAKVLKQDALDPILPGMVIANPAFKRGERLNFVLVGRFREGNVEQLLSRYPCQVQKEVTRETDYVVTGQAPVQRGQPRAEDSPSVERAKAWEITVMKEDDLLRYLGELD